MTAPTYYAVTADPRTRGVCDAGGPGWVAVVAGPVRVLIDTCGGDPGSVTLAPAGGPVLAGGARVDPLAARRAR
jgi:hypothetical protein